MSNAQILTTDARLIAAEATLADALIARAPSIFPRLTDPDEIRNVLMRLVSFAQIKLLQMPVRRDLRDLAGEALRDIGCCVRGDNRDHTTGMAALQVIQAVFAHAGENDLADALTCGVRTLCQRMKVN